MVQILDKRLFVYYICSVIRAQRPHFGVEISLMKQSNLEFQSRLTTEKQQKFNF